MPCTSLSTYGLYLESRKIIRVPHFLFFFFPFLLLFLFVFFLSCSQNQEKRKRRGKKKKRKSCPIVQYVKTFLMDGGFADEVARFTRRINSYLYARTNTQHTQHTHTHHTGMILEREIVQQRLIEVQPATRSSLTRKSWIVRPRSDLWVHDEAIYQNYRTPYSGETEKRISK